MEATYARVDWVLKTKHECHQHLVYPHIACIHAEYAMRTAAANSVRECGTLSTAQAMQAHGAPLLLLEHARA